MDNDPYSDKVFPIKKYPNVLFYPKSEEDGGIFFRCKVISISDDYSKFIPLIITASKEIKLTDFTFKFKSELCEIDYKPIYDWETNSLIPEKHLEGLMGRLSVIRDDF